MLEGCNQSRTINLQIYYTLVKLLIFRTEPIGKFIVLVLIRILCNTVHYSPSFMGRGVHL